jgi:hypothetical protein
LKYENLECIFKPFNEAGIKMKNELLKAIKNIKENKNLKSFDESATKQTIILRIFSILNWDLYNANEVYPEYSDCSGTRVDYSLRLESKNKVFVEAKRIRENLENHQEQLLNYSFKEGVPLAILTNGIHWWFYLPIVVNTTWQQRCFMKIDLFKNDENEIANRFINLLAKEDVKNGNSIKHAEKILETNILKMKLKSKFTYFFYNFLNNDFIDYYIDYLEDLYDKDFEESQISKFLSCSLISQIFKETSFIQNSIIKQTVLENKFFYNSLVKIFSSKEPRLIDLINESAQAYFGISTIENSFIIDFLRKKVNALECVIKFDSKKSCPKIPKQKISMIPHNEENFIQNITEFDNTDRFYIDNKLKRNQTNLIRLCLLREKLDDTIVKLLAYFFKDDPSIQKQIKRYGGAMGWANWRYYKVYQFKNEGYGYRGTGVRLDGSTGNFDKKLKKLREKYKDIEI